MKFKSPRDPNTDPHLKTIRRCRPEDRIFCQVGNGECTELAVESQDNGSGGEFFLCAQHLEEFKALVVLIVEMTANQIKDFESEIKKAENE